MNQNGNIRVSQFHFPNAMVAHLICNECIQKICCHSKKGMRQCPECRRSINAKYYTKHNITNPENFISDDSSDSDLLYYLSSEGTQSSDWIDFEEIRLHSQYSRCLALKIALIFSILAAATVFGYMYSNRHFI